MLVCNYCGYSYISHKCTICGDTISTCGCDCARDICEEHFCAECGEASENLDDEGCCEDCLNYQMIRNCEKLVETEISKEKNE